jgi:phosphotransferase system enzyme I (PtsI)
MRLEGIAASPGIGLGPIVRYEPEPLVPRDYTIEPEKIESEIVRFHAALAASRRDLETIRDGIAAELGEKEALIYEAHLMMLDDPDLKREVEEHIRRERKPVGYCVRFYMSRLVTRLENVEDEYLRERRADVLDVERRLLRHLLGGGPRVLETITEPSVLVAHDIPPSEVALLDRERVLGFVTEVGSRTSHCAIVARGRGIPAVVSVHGLMQKVNAGDVGAVDGFIGALDVNPAPHERIEIQRRRDQSDRERRALSAIHDLPAVTTDGHTLELGVNIELPDEAEGVRSSGADGIGLFRTEFFYLNRLELPTEEEQFAAYRKVAEGVAPRTVIFRTMDLGGDKVASYLGVTHETNPFLGWRGIRFALHHPEVFRTQLRAIYRASAHGHARIMFPMVSSEAELLHALELCAQARAELDRAGQPYDRALPLGIMIETPSAVWMSDVLARHASFFSIGTNDLTQYTLAMDRDNERLAHLYEPLEPAVLRSIRHSVEQAKRAERWVGVCGEMAGDPHNAVLLLGLGVDELSMSSFDLPRVKAAVRAVSFADARRLADEALALPSAAAVKALLRARLDGRLPEAASAQTEAEGASTSKGSRGSSRGAGSRREGPGSRAQ